MFKHGKNFSIAGSSLRYSNAFIRRSLIFILTTVRNRRSWQTNIIQRNPIHSDPDEDWRNTDDDDTEERLKPKEH